MAEKKTGILATIGPASIDHLEAMYKEGMTGIRINSSHGSPEAHALAIERSRAVNPEGYVVYDIKGPKIRLGDLPRPYRIRAGETVVLRTDIAPPSGSEYPAVEDFDRGIPVTYPELDRFAKPGDRFFVDDGYIGLRAVAVEPGRITCTVLYGDQIRSRKGLNHPDTVVGYPYTMPHDLPNLDFALRHRVDFIADSFTRDADDVLELRGRLEGTGIRIVSKIENPEGVNNFDDILKETDAVMIARGDLGVEMDPYSLPEMQKVMIEKCNRAGKPVVTATQMLESMLDNPYPSRSDVSDIANAIYDGTDVVMLSGETSVGKYPVQCVSAMRLIAEMVEGTERYRAWKKTMHTLGASGKKAGHQ